MFRNASLESTTEIQLRHASNAMSFEVHELLLDLPVELYALCYRSGVGSADSVAYLGSGDGVLLAYEIPKPGGAVDRPISFRNAWKLPQRTKIKQIVCPVWDPGTLWLVNGGMFDPELCTCVQT